MKVQTLNENLIKALSGIKENKVDICNVVVNRKPLLEALKINKQFDRIILETGKTTWQNLSKNGEYLQDRGIVDRPSLRISLDHTVMTFFHSPDPLKPVANVEFNDPQKQTGIALDTNLLIDALAFAAPCMADDESRPVLYGVLFDAGENTLKLLSADGYRLAITGIPAQGIPEFKAILHKDDVNRLMAFLKAIKPIGKGKSKTWPDVSIEHTDKSLKFTTANSTITFDLVQGTYPDYAKLLPNGDLTKVDFVNSDMLNAVRGLKSLAVDSGTGIIRLTFADSSIRLTAKSEETGESEAHIDARIIPNEHHTEKPGQCRIALQAKYLDTLLGYAKDGIVTAQVQGDTYPIAFTLPDGKYQVVMPMFVQWE